MKNNLDIMPNNPIAEGLKCPEGESWHNNIRFEIWDKNKDEPIRSEIEICYSHITRRIVSLLGSSDEDYKNYFIRNGFIRFFCKNGDNKRRFKFIKYIKSIFRPLYKTILVYWSEEYQEIIVDAYLKPTTPLDSIYALGSFLRLSWEQWCFWDKDTDDNFELLVQANHSKSTGHIPTLFFDYDFKYFDDSENVGRTAMQILVRMIPERRVYKNPMNETNFKSSFCFEHQIQISARNAVINSPEFLSHHFVTTRPTSLSW